MSMVITPHCDVFSATDISHMPILKERQAQISVHARQQYAMRAQFTAQSDLGWHNVTNAGRWSGQSIWCQIKAITVSAATPPGDQGRSR
jgi:hypothetical protein